MALEYLVYVSRASNALTQEDLDSILTSCQKNNPDLEITGMLLYIEGRFLQVLEGEKENIDILIEKISNDSRHTDPIIISRGALKWRIFKDWSMRFNSISENEFRRISGISKLAELFKLKARGIDKPILTFIRKFSDKEFPSPSWWAN